MAPGSKANRPYKDSYGKKIVPRNSRASDGDDEDVSVTLTDGSFRKDLGDGTNIFLHTRASETNKKNWLKALATGNVDGDECPEPPVKASSPPPLVIMSPEQLELKARSRNYHIEINNPTPDTLYHLDNAVQQCVFARVGFEIGSKNGVPHMQGVMCFKNARVQHSVLKMIGGVGYCKPCYCSATVNDKYCSKDACTFFAIGASPPWESQGKRRDIDDTYDLLKDGCNMRQVVQSMPGYQGIQIAKCWLGLLEQKKNWQPEVRWYWGELGSGKNHYAEQWLDGDRWEAPADKSGSSGWIEAYDGHEDVLLDDLRPGHYSSMQLLRMFGKQQCNMPYKGGFRQFRPKRIAVTTLYPPEMFWAMLQEKERTTEPVGQLMRRINAKGTVVQVLPIGNHPINETVSLVLGGDTGQQDLSRDEILAMRESEYTEYTEYTELTESLESDVSSICEGPCGRSVKACICEDIEASKGDNCTDIYSTIQSEIDNEDLYTEIPPFSFKRLEARRLEASSSDGVRESYGPMFNVPKKGMRPSDRLWRSTQSLGRHHTLGTSGRHHTPSTLRTFNITSVTSPSNVVTNETQSTKKTSRRSLGVFRGHPPEAPRQRNG